MTDSPSDTVSSSEGGDEKRRGLVRRCDRGLSPVVDRPLFFVEDNKGVLFLWPSQSDFLSFVRLRLLILPLISYVLTG